MFLQIHNVMWTFSRNSPCMGSFVWYSQTSEDQWLQFGNGYDPSTRITVKARRLTGETLNGIMWHPNRFFVQIVCF